MQIDGTEKKFIANCFIHEAAKLSREKFLEKLNHIKHIRTTDLKAFSLIPKTEEDWVAIERFYYIVTKGDFGPEASFPYDRPGSNIFGVYVPIDLFNWFINNSLSTIQKQITLYIASLSFAIHEDIRKDIFPSLLTEIERIISKYYSGKDLWNAEKMNEAYINAALDYFNSQIPLTLSLERGAEEKDVFVRTAYFSFFDWNNFVLNKVTKLHEWFYLNGRIGARPKPDEENMLVKMPTQPHEKAYEDDLERAESVKDAWSMWNTTFRRYPITKSHIFSLFEDEDIGYIYIFKCGSSNKYKIGWTSNSNIDQRKSSLQTGTPEPLGVIDYFPVASKKAEKTIHIIFSKNRGIGEWFELSDKEIDNLRSPVWRRENNIF